MLSLDEVKLILKAGRPKWIKESEEEAERLEVHINGEDTAKYLKPLKGWENKEQEEARKQLVTSNRFLFENLTRPIDKVFSATGGNNVYPKRNNKEITRVVGNIRHGYSIKKWIQSVQANKYYTDPNGLVFFEWTVNGTYPTIKCIDTIFNYYSDGRSVQWIVFNEETTEEGIFVRVVDESMDYTYKKEGDNLTLIEDRTFKNPFGRCPAIVNSDIMHYELNRKDSPFAPIVDLADHYLRTGSVKNIYENYHGYPIFWAYAMPCKKCNGTGSETDGAEVYKCSSCGGKGHTLRKDVTDVISLKPPVDDTQQKLAPDVAGFVQPDLETWKEMRTELDSLWQMMHFTVWGTSYQRDQETATATYIDAQPVNERLSQFSEAFEDMEQKMTELVALYINKTADNVSINWGKRFLIESPDAIWNKYLKAKTDGAPKTTLDYLLNQFYQSEYANDTESLNVSTKKVKLEPFVHLTEAEVKENGITGTDLTAKLYFNEWVKSVDDAYIFVTDIKKLNEDFNAFVKIKDDSINKNNLQDEQVQ